MPSGNKGHSDTLTYTDLGLPSPTGPTQHPGRGGILRGRKRRLREGMSLAHNHTAGLRQSQGHPRVCLTPESQEEARRPGQGAGTPSLSPSVPFPPPQLSLSLVHVLLPRPHSPLPPPSLTFSLSGSALPFQGEDPARHRWTERPPGIEQPRTKPETPIQ